MLAILLKKIFSNSFFRVVLILLWIFFVSYHLRFQDTPRRNHHGYIKNKILFGFCLDVDEFGEVMLAKCVSDKTPRWHLRGNKLSHGPTRKCVSYDMMLTSCDKVTKWSYNQKTKQIINEDLKNCLAVDFESKSVHQWACDSDNEFNRWEFVPGSLESGKE